MEELGLVSLISVGWSVFGWVFGLYLVDLGVFGFIWVGFPGWFAMDSPQFWWRPGYAYKDFAGGSNLNFPRSIQTAQFVYFGWRTDFRISE